MSLFFISGCATVNSKWAEMQNEPSFEASDSFDISAATGAGAVLSSIFAPTFSQWLGLPAQLFDPKMALAFYLLYDPLAPNWQIKGRRINDNQYEFKLRAKNFRTGGDGESRLVVIRRAKELQAAAEASSYRIVEFNEGVISATPFPHRYAEAIIELSGAKKIAQKQ